jgi:hypothetical protein
MDRKDFENTDGMGFVQLANGDRVASDSLAWRDECATRWRHVQTLRSIGSVVERRAYVAQVAHREGNEAGKRLTEAYADDFEKRKAAEAAARAQVAP